MTEEIQETESYVMSEADIKKLVRNALMVAGQEMGAEGDHWPVIKNTITAIMRDWEELDAERRYQAEMKKHLYGQLHEMEEIMRTCTPEVQAIVAPRLAELREVYDAFYEDTGEVLIDLTQEDEEEEDKPLHVRRAEAIIQTMEEDNV
jgi:hypothetical protein